MFKFHKSQVTAFEGAINLDFENRMVFRARMYSPRLYQVIGEQQMRLAVRRGIESACKHGFTRQGPIQLYIETMLLFGSGVSSDPQYPWATRLLCTERNTDQLRRAELLYRDVRRYLRDVHGSNNRYIRQALKRLAESNPREVEFPTGVAEEGIFDFLRWVHPEKCAHTHEQAILLLIREAIAKAARYSGRCDGHDAGVMAALMFSFGHACDSDPLYPWIERTLMRSRRPGTVSKMRVLERQALTWLKAALTSESEQAHDKGK